MPAQAGIVVIESEKGFKTCYLRAFRKNSEQRKRRFNT